MKYDFSGWATRNNIKCSDGRTIRKNAFIENDGQKVPLVWNHQHNEPENILGHALLENREEGVYAYCAFNETESGNNAKMLVQHGDITSLSIFANKLQQNNNDVIHGVIREVSLVLAGANEEAKIEPMTVVHGYDENDDIYIFVGDDTLSLEHGDINIQKNNILLHKDDISKIKTENKDNPDTKNDDKKLKDVINSMSEEQRTAMDIVVGMVLEKSGVNVEPKTDKEDIDMKHNIFNKQDNNEDVLAHSEMMAIIDDGKRYGSLKESALQHGIEDIEYLFPEAHNLNTPPEFINRDQGWVTKVLNGVHKSPFSRIKSIFADIREDDARALGYLPDRTHRDAKGNLVDASGKPAYKKEEVFGLLKRITTPATIYKKQKLDRDDVNDITDFDAVAWIKAEMRMMLNEEIARAILIGDGRSSSSDDKINEMNIRPIWTDEDLFTVKVEVATTGKKAKEFIKAVIKSRKQYKGSGNPKLYTTEDVITDCLLLEDENGRFIYESEEKLRNVLRVSEIVTVPVMEGVTRTETTGEHRTMELMGIIVNLTDYNVGADKGGAVNMFDDFDIDYNAQKYLIETRCSGALTKPYSALAIEIPQTGAAG